VLVLGTAQDGGRPQLGCEAECCRSARTEPERGRRVTSLLLCDPRDGRRWLFDCSPDVEAQLGDARGEPVTRASDGPRPPLVDGVFLTHAHMGHYAGLLEFGREAYAARDLPAWVSDRFAAFLLSNAPWNALVEERRIELRRLEPGVPVALAQDLWVTPFTVPHRDEHSDTLGFEIRGPARTLVYLPDIDKWERWDAAAGAGAVERMLARCDVALLDGCFFADGEIPGRPMADIPHPFIAESLARFAPLPASVRARIRFTHLNHTNPAADPGPARARVEAAGMSVLSDGQRFGL
jgi:pyrroloquinoline quinone biosynthesis protein B